MASAGGARQGVSEPHCKNCAALALADRRDTHPPRGPAGGCTQPAHSARHGARHGARYHPHAMNCRPACAACCIEPSISSPIPGMPHGKPAGVPCRQLDEQLRCQLFDSPLRPAVCTSLRPSLDMCGTNRTQAMQWLQRLDVQTTPDFSAWPAHRH